MIPSQSVPAKTISVEGAAALIRLASASAGNCCCSTEVKTTADGRSASTWRRQSFRNTSTFPRASRTLLMNKSETDVERNTSST